MNRVYSEIALRKTMSVGTVHTRHQLLVRHQLRYLDIETGM